MTLAGTLLAIFIPLLATPTLIALILTTRYMRYSHRAKRTNRTLNGEHK